jgi:uncharacterized BrkB/YihY/UPF0761 family membrane protein
VSSPTPQRTRAVWDIVLSIVFLVIAIVLTVLGGLLGLFSAAFTDNCPASTCNQSLGIAELFGVYGFLIVAVVVAIILTIVFLTRRRRAWWLGASAIVLSIVCAIAAEALYSAAVGYT